MAEEIREIEQALMQKVASKPPLPVTSASSGKVAVLNVQYDVDSCCNVNGDNGNSPVSAIQDNKSVNGHTGSKQVQPRSKSPEVLSMMAKLDMAEKKSGQNRLKSSSSEADIRGLSEGNIGPGSRSGSPTKQVSSGEKNYYEMSIHKNHDVTTHVNTKTQVENNDSDSSQVPTRDNSGHSDSTKAREVKKTVTTLQLLDDQHVTESKQVSIVTTQVCATSQHRHNSGVCNKLA